jgi:hypothetical protein
MKAYNDTKEKTKQAKIRALRSYLPYGKWTCADGREVLFNRAYKPIWQRRNGRVEIADAREWVKDIQGEEWFFNDLTAPWEGYTARGCRKTLLKCIGILEAWGVFRKDAEHHLIGPERGRELAVIPGGRAEPSGSEITHPETAKTLVPGGATV